MIVLSRHDEELLYWQEVFGDPPHLENGPGLDALRYRIGTYDTWVDLMIHALMDWEHFPLATAPTEVGSEETFMSRRTLSTEQRRRIRLNLSEEDNWILGLVKAWATVGDVLTFYQERLLNEGYLRTARQPFSVHELVRLLDDRPQPAVGGSVELAFSATDVEGLPPRVTIPAGTVITSVPPPGADPQSFETAAPLEARAEWNLLRAAEMEETAPPVASGATIRLRLAGAGLGLGVGTGVLIRGRRDGEEAAFFRLASAVETVSAAPASTEVTWQEPLDGQAPGREITDLEIDALRQEARPFGHNAPRWEEQPVEVRRKHRPIEGGVRVLSEGDGWRPLNEGLGAATIQCLLSDPRGNLFAGTAGEGVLCWLAGSGAWRGGKGGAPQLDVRSLAVGPGGGVLAGTADGGVYRSTDRGGIWTELTGRALGSARWTLVRRAKRLDRLPPTPVRALLAAGEGERWSVLAGTDSGVYLSTDLGNTWQPRNGGLPGVDAKTGETSLAIGVLVAGATAGEIYAATAGGVFKSANLGRRWSSISRGLPGVDPATGLTGEPIRALAFYRDRRRQDNLFAGTSEGVFRSADGGARWKPARQGMLRGGGNGVPRTGRNGEFPEVTSLVTVADPITVTTRVFAGAADGLWRSDDLGDSWRPVELGAAGVSGLAAGPRAELAAASPLGGFATEEWPGYYLSRGRIDLERAVPGIAADGWVVLAPDPDVSDPPPVGIYRVRDVATVQRRDFTLAAPVTRLEVDRDPALRRYDLRRTRIYFHSQALPLLPRKRPADPSTVVEKLRSVLATLHASRPVIATADRGVAPAAGEETPGEEAPAGGAPGEGNGDETAYGRAMTAGVLESALAASDGVRPLELPADDAGAKSDPAGASTVAVEAPSLAVQANAVAATEGKTLRGEVLGHGDASRILQRFTLAEPPAYLPPGSGTPAPRSTIEVRVQGQPWREVPRLYGEGADRRVFEVQRDHQGRATAIFGDGVHGARLPTGHGNVVADYRTGTSDRGILAGSVRLMSSRPLGLAAVVNPLAGTPGAPAEDPESVRRRAPRSVLTMDRIVSLRDYEDFAWSFPGIVKATARGLALVGRQIVHLTVATREANHRPAAGSRLLRQLLQAIEEICCDPEPVHIVPFRPVGLEIAAEVRIRRGADWDEIEPRLRAALGRRFNFDESRFGDSLNASEAIRVLQSVEEVVAVDLNVFRRVGASESLARRVKARPALWDGRSEAPSPAELVWLDRVDLKRLEKPPEGGRGP